MVVISAKKSFFVKCVSFAQAIIFLISSLLMPGAVRAQVLLDLPAPGIQVPLSSAFIPVNIRAIKFDPAQPLVFNFIVDSGNSDTSRNVIKSESEKLARFFLASLTIPEKDLWVNLSPYESDRIIPEGFGQTEMGRDLLGQDYLLKQISASLLNPEKDLGKEFWSRVYSRIEQELGSVEIPSDTFNKVWIVPQKAVVYEIKGENAAILGETHLQVLLDQDYLAMKKNLAEDVSVGADVSAKGITAVSRISTDAIRAIVLPEIEKEVNAGKNFSLLRQVYSALILATWYKENLKESLLAQVYSNQNKIAGVDVADKAEKDRIYERYLSAFRQGVFNLIKEDVDPVSHETLPRKYFSGGATFSGLPNVVAAQKLGVTVNDIPAPAQSPNGNFSQVTISLTSAGSQNASELTMTNELRQDLLKRPNLPVNVKQMLLSEEISTHGHALALRFLLDDQQKYVLNALSLPGSKIKEVLDQLIKGDLTYPSPDSKTGNLSYVTHANNLMNGRIPEPKEELQDPPPSTRYPALTDPKYVEAHATGLRHAGETVLIQVAGGAGQRLQADPGSIKTGLEIDPITNKTFFQIFAEHILESENEADRLNGTTGTRIEFFQMVSDETIDGTKKLLNDNKVTTANGDTYFGLQGVSYLEVGKHWVDFDSKANKLKVYNLTDHQYLGDLNQVTIAKQPSVFAIAEEKLSSLKSDGGVTKKAYLIVNQNTGLLEKMPHGHVDVHLVMKQLGLAQAYQKAGKKNILFFQDTNLPVFDAIWPTLGQGISKKAKLFIASIFRNKGERVGALAVVKDENGSYTVQNKEYNYIKALAASLGKQEDDFNAGNINVFGLDIAAYNEIIERTGGVMGEMWNPKTVKIWDALTNTRIERKVSRLEGLMQSIFNSVTFQDWDNSPVSTSVFEGREIFNTTKNSFRETLKYLAPFFKGVTSSVEREAAAYRAVKTATEHQSWMAGWTYQNNRIFLRNLGMNIPTQSQVKTVYRRSDGKDYIYQVYAKPDGTEEDFVVGLDDIAGNLDGKVKPQGTLLWESHVPGVITPDGAKVVLSPSFTYHAGRENRVNGGSVSPASVLNVEGDCVLHNVSIDGYVQLTADEGSRLTLRGTTLRNAGKVWVDLPPEALTVKDQREAFSQTARMLGGYFLNGESVTVRVLKGEVVIGDNVTLRNKVYFINWSNKPLDVNRIPGQSRNIVLDNKFVLKTASGDIQIRDASQQTDDPFDPVIRGGVRALAENEMVSDLILKPDFGDNKMKDGSKPTREKLEKHLNELGLKVLFRFPSLQLRPEQVKKFYSGVFANYNPDDPNTPEFKKDMLEYLSTSALQEVWIIGPIEGKRKNAIITRDEKDGSDKVSGLRGEFGFSRFITKQNGVHSAGPMSDPEEMNTAINDVNILFEAYDVNKGNEVAIIGDEAYLYNDNRKPIKLPDQLTALDTSLGITIGGVAVRKTINDEDVIVIEQKTSNGKPGKRFEYVRDALGQWIKSTGITTLQALVDMPLSFPVQAALGKDTFADQADYGGIDLANAAAGIHVERAGGHVRVSVESAVLQQIKTQGVSGFRPVIVNIVPVTSMLPMLTDAAMR